MNIKILAVGKTDNENLKILIDDYVKRMSHYINFNFQVINSVKKTKYFTKNQQKKKEGELILTKITNSDLIILLDEKGNQYDSITFSTFLQKQMNSGLKQLVFIIGGSYGFSEEIYARANGKISLSKMTFSHQMIRLFIVEQLYRGFTILKNEPYHHR